MKSISLSLVTYREPFFKFCEWYKNKNNKISLNDYLQLDFEYQIGHLLLFLNENNIHILAGNDFYIIYTIVSINSERHKVTREIEDKEIDKSLPEIYNECIIKSFEYLTNPF
jgi:hypothetical protein